ncbi:reprolysin-like metallopeptidase [Dyella sp. EPa41]|uniref:reprolysin-like metallopeptidase n=1 Tax=Dyella sp. EPa41 TaxID=1561194 RepID=UPI00191651EC|nr:FG-GAP-like repeat-containing protein [Dyella sp. EPa41]
MRKVLFALLALGASSVCVAGAPELVRQISTKDSFLQGNERLFPVDLQRDAVRTAQTEGGLWFTTPDGEHLFARTVRVDKQADGNQTWIGTLATKSGDRSIVITVGTDAVFGSLLSSDAKPLRLVTRQGKSYITKRDEQIAAAQATLQAPFTAPVDYVLPPVAKTPPTGGSRVQSAAAGATLLAAAPGTGPTVDVLLGYTPGMVTQIGSASGVVTRLNYLVAVANQAYSDSQVSGRVRLVGTMLVNYQDYSNDNTVLTDLVNPSSTGPLAALRAQRHALGADLVSLVRPFSSTGQGGVCGLGYLNFSSGAPLSTALAPYGYSTIGDGVNGGYYCLDTTLAHEMGHNMGLAHDIADANGPGVFPYAYGWRQTLTTGSFYTIMAYSADNQQPVPYFADPAINLCNGNPCGDVTQANQTLALNQTMSIVAAFNAPGQPSLDLDGDGSADLMLQNPSIGQYASLLVQDASVQSGRIVSVAAGYHIAAIGDFDNSGSTDLVWTSAANDLYLWMNDGTGHFASNYLGVYPAGWTLIGAADLNGDGKSDLLWMNNTTHQFGYWLMDGAKSTSIRSVNVTPGYYIAAVGDFEGNGHTDLVWTSPNNDLYLWINNGSGSFSSVRGLDYPAGWQLVGAGDVDGDQKADLIWTNDTTHQFAYWTMNGTTRTGYSISTMPSGYHIAAIDRFSSSVVSILWNAPGNYLYLWRNNGSGAFSTDTELLSFPADPTGSTGFYWAYPNGWSVVSGLITRP